MKTVILGPRSREVDALIARRHALGQDRYDEVWEGEYHMAPMAHPRQGYVDQQLAEILGPEVRKRGLLITSPVNVGEPDDFRVPDRVIHREFPATLYVPTAAMVIEVLSDHDETFEKFSFYARRGVEEIVVVDPRERTVRLWHLVDGEYVARPASDVIDLDCAELAARIDWPAASAD